MESGAVEKKEIFIMDIEQLKNEYAQGKQFKYVFFWGHKKFNKITKTCFSQWYECKFTVDGVEYHTAEQYMMAQKAVLFGDKEVLQKIMSADNPAVYKSLGRQIRNFDENIWNEHKFQIVVNGNTAKFSQNPELLDFLLKTGDRVLVEASPYDRIWGIGLAKDTPDIENPFKWKGINLLGFALMEVRENLK